MRKAIAKSFRQDAGADATAGSAGDDLDLDVVLWDLGLPRRLGEVPRIERFDQHVEDAGGIGAGGDRAGKQADLERTWRRNRRLQRKELIDGLFRSRRLRGACHGRYHV